MEAISLNFKDTMLLLGVLDASAFKGGWTVDAIGLECSGIVTAVGSKAPSWVKVGDRVMSTPPYRHSAFQKYIEAPFFGLTKVI